mmetsp:Transcript_14906/g.41291  ORF Transcript_14906/g.41291 Transcript_14906/m.41291 type:complete len:422 (-) Transcript_14906:265-1530(-)|eukprot:CAMPEP_0198129404 /NCGR_PEP_ID=MMETSP1442-20131203/51650_1 /TAXON_ID= /ORGANISM="Craspedostauros australis, Strain CCMP3328" /LENGTH=421 /DNA_ID=CAMNT_0043789787 /DNA_START=122 /DNA_END=1387 /DNA_ORIENTATION=+
MSSPRQGPLVLSLNAGSSSVKASLLEGERSLVSFLAERLASPQSAVYAEHFGRDATDGASGQDGRVTIAECGGLSHKDALSHIIAYLEKRGMLKDLVAVGHRVVHGGAAFSDSVIIDDENLRLIQSVSNLAPLHNPHNLTGIHAIRSLKPDIANVAVFDTSFHATLPERASTYPIPAEYRELGMRKYGFHGTSVNFVTQKAESILQNLQTQRDGDFQLIVCHLGNGASITSVSSGKSVETSMGFTPLAGLMMGTRCGSVDPSLVNFACHALNKDVDEVLNDFNKNSGLKGMNKDGINDMRELLSRSERGDAECALAVDMFVYRLSQQIASSMIALAAPLDALIFTAGIGEHSAEIRRRTVKQLGVIIPGARLDEGRNYDNGRSSNGIISADETWPLILDIATDEEAMIAKECTRLVQPKTK